MNHSMTSKQPEYSNSNGGFALVLVLSVIVLVALMIIVATERSKTDLRSSDAFSKANQVQRLSDMTLNIVKAQIRDATTINQTTTTPIDLRDMWASQPGALRTFAPNGSLRRIYKLYSSNELQTTNPDFSADVPSDWHTRPAEFTDLNAPVGTSYPILNPNVASLVPEAAGIEQGFSIDGAPVAPGSDSNPAPMPVRWIYVLEDGTLCQLGDARIDLDSNAIVGRIAFWSDDETAKVNINTAAPVTENAFWDAPRAVSLDEYILLALRQPAQNEYQRYPGHPAMVSLRSVLGDLGLSNEEYFSLSPYYRWGGSEEGARTIEESRVSLLTNKEDRSYATVDEILFDGFSASRRTFLPQEIGQLHFFLTSNSGAPELNLFGQPRVSIWPIHSTDSLTTRTPFDSLIAFSSTIGGRPYYFTRQNPLSATEDFDGILRNRKLYSYLQRLTSSPVPGFGGDSFLAKYADDRDQILTQIFDYIRTTNLNETFQNETGQRPAGFQSYTPDWTQLVLQTANYPIDSPLRGAGMVVPIEINDTRGMGRFPALAEVGLFFIVRSEFRPGPPPNKSNPPVDKPPAPDPDNRLVLEAMLVMETITPAFGFMPWIGRDFQVRLRSSSVGVNIDGGAHQLFPSSVQGTDLGGIYYPPAVAEGLSPGGYDGAGYLYGIDGLRISGNGSGVPSYRFFSQPIVIEGAPVDFSVSSGELEIDFLVAGEVVQSYTFEFRDSGSLPLPEINPGDYAYTWNPNFGRPWWQSRFNHPAPRGPGRNDVVQSLELIHGDARLVAGLKEVPADLFVPHENYGTQAQAHGFRSIANAGTHIFWHGGTGGSYFDLPLFSQSIPATQIQGANRPPYDEYFYTAHPKIRSSITDLISEGWSGDFDNGWIRFLDGPFINKPDEGMKEAPPAGGSFRMPYEDSQWSIGEGMFSPLRQVPSPVMFGSLPTGVKASIPWRTLLFCPNPADPSHYGFQSPADHLLLDLFRMPVVEPIALSGPASTNGKINMNYRPAPFSYIRRQTALYAALETLKLFSVQDTQSNVYKRRALATSQNLNVRTSVNIPQTLQQFESRFNSNDVFRSATEICSLFLVPDGETLTNVQNLTTGYWSTKRPTGDNSREKPYAELYPKLTTQSNSCSPGGRRRLHPRRRISRFHLD